MIYIYIYDIHTHTYPPKVNVWNLNMMGFLSGEIQGFDQVKQC